MSKPYRICILGGGIVGLTTCCYFLKTYSPSSITVKLISDEFSPNITSTVAAGYWHSPEGEYLTKLALHSYDIFLSESYSIKAQDAGVMSMTSYVLHGSDGKYSTPDYVPNDTPLFSSYVKHFHHLSKEELQMFDTLKPVSGYSFTTVVVETKKYLNCLMLYLKQQSNVEFIQKHVNNLDELSSVDNFDLIVNCTGLGARELVADDAVNLYGGRGQVVRICAPYIKSVYLFDDGLGYIIPQTDHVVLGGTNEKNNESKGVNPAQTIEILQKSTKIFPSLVNYEIKEVCVGFRPIRRINGVTTVRIEFDQKKQKVIHNYGHGGVGITLSWGCARQVIELAQTVIPSSSSGQAEKKSPVEHEKLWQIIE